MQNNRNYNESLDVRLVIRAIIKHWKSLIIVSVLFAAIFPIFKYKMDPPVTEEEPSPNQEVVQIDSPEVEQYQNELEVLLSNKSDLENYISEVEEQYSQLTKEKTDLYQHRKESVLLNLNPYKVTKAMRTYSVGRAADGESIDDNQLKQIIAAYTNAANVANEEINETINTPTKISTCEVTSNGNTITISTIAPDEKTAKEYLNNADEAIEKVKSSVEDSLGRHTINTINDKIFVESDEDLRAAQEAYDDTKIAAINSVEDKLMSLNSSLYTINTQIRGTDSARRSASAPPSEDSDADENEEENKGTTKKDIVIWAILGFVVGTILASIWFGFRYFLSDTLRCSDDVYNRFGIRILGTSKNEDSIPVLSEVIEKLIGDGESLVLVSTLGIEICKSFGQTIRKSNPELSVEEVGDLKKEAKGLKLLDDNKKVVLIEAVDLSPVSMISYEIELINISGAEIIGCIID